MTLVQAVWRAAAGLMPIVRKTTAVTPADRTRRPNRNADCHEVQRTETELASKGNQDGLDGRAHPEQKGNWLGKG